MSAQAARCDDCDAVCCRLTVVLMEGDRRVPAHLTAVTDRGLHVMARDEDGWCVAVDPASQRCSIYDDRPQACRRFAMNGPYCRDVRADYVDRRARDIPLALYC